MVVREAGLSDLTHLVEFNVAMAWETEKRRLEKHRLRAGITAIVESSTRGLYLVGDVFRPDGKGEIISQLLITYEWSDWRNGQFWWIQSVYVHPDWRGQGAFRHMYQYVEQKARSCPDVCGIRLYVEQENTKALAVYRKLGFAHTSYRILETDFMLSSQTPYTELER